jgi:hypothetical protein
MYQRWGHGDLRASCCWLRGRVGEGGERVRTYCWRWMHSTWWGAVYWCCGAQYRFAMLWCWTETCVGGLALVYHAKLFKDKAERRG